ncbi:hypothetical protein [Ekhidna sp.]|uniref:hypothetical protein n=1 Tax=Ekhidna sp. TaxID=2608089 RepID=UPI00351824A1
MLKRSLHIIIALLLVFTTTASIWEQLIADQDSVEISFEYETDAEKGEKESKKEVDSWDDDLTTEAANIHPELYSGFQKVGSSTFAPIGGADKKLYLLFQRLKLDC